MRNTEYDCDCDYDLWNLNWNGHMPASLLRVKRVAFSKTNQLNRYCMLNTEALRSGLWQFENFNEFLSIFVYLLLKYQTYTHRDTYIHTYIHTPAYIHTFDAFVNMEYWMKVMQSANELLMFSMVIVKRNYKGFLEGSRVLKCLWSDDSFFKHFHN